MNTDTSIILGAMFFVLGVCAFIWLSVYWIANFINLLMGIL